MFLSWARSILNLKSASLHQSSASSLLIDLTIRISFCNTENVPMLKKKTTNKKKEGPMILIPLEPRISPLTTWFSISLTALKALKRSLTISAWDGTSRTSRVQACSHTIFDWKYVIAKSMQSCKGSAVNKGKQAKGKKMIKKTKHKL